MNSVIPSTTAPVPTPAANWYVEPVLNTPLPDLEHYYQADRLASFDDAIIQVEFANNHQPMPAGPEHWEEQRKEWLKHSKHVHPVDEQDPFNAKLRNPDPDHLVRLYREINNEARPLKRPLRLSQLIPILVAGWKHEGLWPSEESLREEIRQHKLNPSDYDLKVHLSGILDSDAPPEREPNLAVGRVLARQNNSRKQR